MKNEVYYYSFVCQNEQPKSLFQLVLKGYERKGNQITYVPEMPRKVSHDSTHPNIIKLNEMLNELETRNSTSINSNKVLSPDPVSFKLETLFTGKWIIAQQDGYLFEFLDYHLTEYQGKKIDFLNHLQSKYYRRNSPVLVWIEKQLSSIEMQKSTKVSAEKSERVLNNMEKMMTIHFLQRAKLLISSDQESTYASLDNLFAVLTNIGFASFKDLRTKTLQELLKTTGPLGIKSGKERLGNLDKIKPFLLSLDNENLTKEILAFENNIKARMRKK